MDSPARTTPCSSSEPPTDHLGPTTTLRPTLNAFADQTMANNRTSRFRLANQAREYEIGLVVREMAAKYTAGRRVTRSMVVGHAFIVLVVTCASQFAALILIAMTSLDLTLVRAVSIAPPAFAASILIRVCFQAQIERARERRFRSLAQRLVRERSQSPMPQP